MEVVKLNPGATTVLGLVFAVLLVTSGQFGGVHSSDPELTSDFFVPEGVLLETIVGSNFTFTGLRPASSPSPAPFSALKATSTNFPLLTGLSVSIAVLSFHPDALNPPHTHPRGTELLYVLKGSLEVGFVDTTNKLYNSTLFEGDLFVFPEGLVHYQFNPSTVDSSMALASFSSSNPGTVSLSTTLFASTISDLILEQSFNATAMEIDELEGGFGTANSSSYAPAPTPIAGMHGN